MKAHIGTDTKRGIVHTVVCTTAKVHDSQEFEELLHGEEQEVYGDKAYTSKKRKQQLESRGIECKIARKSSRAKPLSKRDKQWNRKQSKVRAKGEHAFGVVKHLWGYAKTRYRGIAKNAAQLFSLFALANLYLLRKELSRMQT